MLDRLDMEFEGQPHCGLDDAKNIARIAIRLLKDKAVIRVNEKLQKVGKGKVDSIQETCLQNLENPHENLKYCRKREKQNKTTVFPQLVSVETILF